MKTPEMSDRLVLVNGAFIALMLVIQFVPIPFLILRIALAIAALVSLALVVVFAVRDH